MDEYVFDPGVMDILDGKDLVVTIVAHDDHGFAYVTVAIAQPDGGAVIAVPHSQVLRAGGQLRIRVPMAVKVERKKVVKKRGRKKTPAKKEEKSEQVK